MALTADVQGRAATIAASATTTTLALNYARRWRLTVQNTHATQTLTVCRLRRRTHREAPWSEWVPVASGLPVAAGATLTITPDGDDCAEDLDVELTASGAGTGVKFWLAGSN
jgi:hypothetical protein